MNSYLLEGEDFGAISTEIKHLIESNKFNEASISNYDMEVDLLDKVLEDLDTYSFLSDKKVIIISNMDKININDNSNYLDHFYRYLDNPSNDNLLIMYGTKYNNTLKITKELKKKCNYIEISIDPNEYIMNIGCKFTCLFNSNKWC